ncbi:MAG: serine/threonine-protein phosphatase [Planctomycetaceae bacterium]|nr:serine/threonine-protein phosphatase [Planctomycetaceae bacterium]
MTSVSSFPVEDCGQRLSVVAGGASAQGCCREQNQDCYVIDPDGYFAVVADGIGGTIGGEVASRIACDILFDEFISVVEREGNVPEREYFSAADRYKRISESVLAAFRNADGAILATGRRYWSLKGMGTTAVSVLMIGEHVYVSNIGDSCAYLIRDGSVLKLTREHTVTAGLIRAGLLSVDQAAVHPYRNSLYKYLGAWSDDDPADVESIHIQHGDILALMTDGVSQYVDESRIAEALGDADHPEQAAGQLVELAVEEGSEDDATCVVIFLS